MNKVWFLVIAVILVAGGYLFMNSNQTMSPTTEQTAPVGTTEQTIMLLEQNQSDEYGTAVLTEENGKVVVTLSMTGAPSGVPQPAHIHTGVCPDVGAVVYPLTNVVNGTSETTLDVTLAELVEQQPLGLNVHKSVPEAKVYVSCGDLSLAAY